MAARGRRRRDGRRPAHRSDERRRPPENGGGGPSLAWGGRRRAVELLADGRAEAPLETRGRLRIVGSGVPAPELQVEIRAGGRLVGVADAWFDDAAVAVEFDGRVTYDQPWRGRSPREALCEEKRREDELRALGIRVLAADELTDAAPAGSPPTAR
jgi:hypothetical protein